MFHRNKDTLFKLTNEINWFIVSLYRKHRQFILKDDLQNEELTKQESFIVEKLKNLGLSELVEKSFFPIKPQTKLLRNTPFYCVKRARSLEPKLPDNF